MTTRLRVYLNGDTTIDGTISSEYCHIGNNDDCMLRIVNEGGEDKMLITLPNKYNREGKNNKETYDMRSIIESIQELNRRTATFNCNVSFLSAMETFDVSAEPNDMFACDQDKDGLPAAHLGEVDMESANGLYKVTLVVTNHENTPIYMLGEENATNSITMGLDNSEISALYDALSRFLETPDNGYVVQICINHDEDRLYELRNAFLTEEQVRGGLDEDTLEILINSLKSIDDLSSINIVAFETIPHKELIISTDAEKIVTFRVLTDFEAGMWTYTSARSVESSEDYNNVLTVKYTDDGGNVAFNSPLQSPITVMRLFSDLTYTKYETGGNASISASDSQRVVQYICTFASNSTIESVAIDHFDSSHVTDMHGLFQDAITKLKSVTFSESFDTSNVTNMSSMFARCSYLQSVNISAFNTRNVTDMSGMFIRYSMNASSSFTSLSIKLSPKFIVNEQCRLDDMFLVRAKNYATQIKDTPIGFGAIQFTKSLMAKCIADSACGLWTNNSIYWHCLLSDCNLTATTISTYLEYWTDETDLYILHGNR